MKSIKKIVFAVWALLSLGVIAHAENSQPNDTEPTTQQAQKKITGTIVDANNEPIIGANVLVKGTADGTITDFDGKFVLDAPSNATLVISYVGFTVQEVDIKGQNTLNIVLQEDSELLDEVVVVGYGVQKKTTLTGAVSTVGGEELAKIPSANVAQTMAGKVAGFSMRPNGGQPGFDTPDIHIRGIVTTGNNKPLIVVDGIKRDNMNQIDPATIETITVLKDAAATAPYGIGGANGVVLITTKRGKTGKPTITFSGSVGTQSPTYLPKSLSGQDYMALQNEGYFNIVPDGKTPPNDPAIVQDYHNLHAQDPFRYPNSDFTDMFERNPLLQKYGVSVSGGTDVVQYQLGLSYYDQKGLFDKTNYNRYNYNAAVDVKVTPTTKMSMSLYGSREHINQFDPGESNMGHLFRSFYRFVPTAAMLYPGGDKWGESNGISPGASINAEGYRKIERNVLLGSVSLEQDLTFLPGLKAKGTFSYDPTFTFNKDFHVPFKYHVIDLTTDPYTFTEAITTHEKNSPTYIYLSEKSARSYNYTWQGQLNYNQDFGDHSVSGLFVFEGRKSSWSHLNARKNSFTVTVDEMNMGSSNKDDFDIGGTSATASELGMVYRLGYVYKGKYSFEASGRYDGHYYFAPESRWGYFPSFSAAWRISEEPFMKQFTNVNNMKLRGSWGKSGMLAGNPFQYMSGYTLKGNAYAFGAGNLTQGSYVSLEANPNITWEIANKADIGFDLNMWNGLFNLEFDYFYEKRSGMLLKPQVIVPLEYGLNLSQENKGVMKNHGFELTLGTSKTFENGMVLNVNGNISYARNQMVEVFESDAERANPNRTKVGRPFGTPYGYKSDGLFSTADDKTGDGIINAEDGYNVKQWGVLRPGDIRYVDLSGPDGVPDGKIDVNDETVIGDPVYPLLTYGITPELSWKGFDVSVFLQGSGISSISVKGFQTVPFENNGSNTTYEFFDNRWTPDTQTSAKYPRTTPSPVANNNKNSDFWMRSTAFLRLKTFTIGYSLPKHLIRKAFMKNVRFYFTTQNLFTISGLNFIDPEAAYNNIHTAYPVMKSTNIGLDITF